MPTLEPGPTLAVLVQLPNAALDQGALGWIHTTAKENDVSRGKSMVTVARAAGVFTLGFCTRTVIVGFQHVSRETDMAPHLNIL